MHCLARNPIDHEDYSRKRFSPAKNRMIVRIVSFAQAWFVRCLANRC